MVSGGMDAPEQKEVCIAQDLGYHSDILFNVHKSFYMYFGKVTA